MSSLQDIRNRDDIDRLVAAFYGKVLHDPIIGYIFRDVAKIDLASHLPVIADFWESMLLNSPVYAKYQRSPILVHLELHEKEALQTNHFDRWVSLFHETVDAMFSGPVAEVAKMRAMGISAFMQREIRARDERQSGD